MKWEFKELQVCTRLERTPFEAQVNTLCTEGWEPLTVYNTHAWSTDHMKGDEVKVAYLRRRVSDAREAIWPGATVLVRNLDDTQWLTAKIVTSNDRELVVVVTGYECSNTVNMADEGRTWMRLGPRE